MALTIDLSTLDGRMFLAGSSASSATEGSEGKTDARLRDIAEVTTWIFDSSCTSGSMELARVLRVVRATGGVDFVSEPALVVRLLNSI